MKIRTVYLKVTDMNRTVEFWGGLLKIEPHKSSSKWHEYMIGSLRLGLLVNDFGDQYQGSNCVPVWKFGDKELSEYIERAKVLGAKVLVDGLDDPNLKSFVFADPFGNEFEFGRFHD